MATAAATERLSVVVVELVRCAQALQYAAEIDPAFERAGSRAMEHIDEALAIVAGAIQTREEGR